MIQISKKLYEYVSPGAMMATIALANAADPRQFALDSLPSVELWEATTKVALQVPVGMELQPFMDSWAWEFTKDGKYPRHNVLVTPETADGIACARSRLAIWAVTPMSEANWCENVCIALLIGGQTFTARELWDEVNELFSTLQLDAV